MFFTGKKIKNSAQTYKRVGNGWLVQAILVGLALSVVVWPSATAQSTCNPPKFATGKTLSADFCTYWLDNGGVSIFGEPITEPAFEVSPETGERVLTQWFERHRFELHPKPGGGNQVVLGKLGLELRAEARNKGPVGEIDPDFRPAEPLVDPDFPPDQQKYFDETKHNLRFKFLAYWTKNGGQERLGLPISEERLEFEPETQRYYVTQWFERARMEYHPENPVETDVLLGLLGAQIKKPDSERQKRLDFQWKLGRSGTFLDQPNSIYVDGTGNVYINDRASGRIDKYNSKFKLVNYWFMVGGGTTLPALEGGTQAIAGVAKAPQTNNGTPTPPPTPTPTLKPGVTPTVNTSQQEKPPILYSLAPNKTNLVRHLTFEGKWETIELKPSGDADSDTPNFGMAVNNDSLYILKSAAFANYLVFKYNLKGDFIAKFVRRGDVSDPTAIAVSGDKLYVADGSSGKYFIFDSGDTSKGEPLNKDGFSLPNTGKTRNITSIAVDQNSGNVLVGETGKITRFDVNNSGPAEFPITAGRAVGQLLNPVGMTTDLKGNLYVADPANHRVVVVSPSGNPSNTIQSLPYNDDGNLGTARSVAVTSGTNAVVLVADPVNQRIDKYDTTGKFQGQWTANGVASIAISPAGEVYGLNTAQGLVTKFDIEGKQLLQWGGIGADKGKFRFPGGIAVGKDGSIFVADTGNQRIQKFDAKGVSVLTWGTKGAGDKEFGGTGLSDLYSGPTSIAVEPSTGNLYVVDSASARIIKYDPNGNLLGVLTQATVDPSRPFEPVAVASPAFQLEKQQSSSNTTPVAGSTSVDDTGLTNGIYIMALQGIYKLDAQDQLSFSFFARAPLPGTDGGDGNIHNLTGLAVDNNGNIFATDNFSRLQKFRFQKGL